MDATHLLEYIETLETRNPRRDEDDYPTLSTTEDVKDKGKAKAQPEPPKPVWLHCSVGVRLEPHEEDDGGFQVSVPSTP